MASLNLLIKKVLDYLKSELREVTTAELSSHLALDLTAPAQQDLFRNLSSNPKIIFDGQSSWRWRSVYHFVKTRADLVTLLRNSPHGIVSTALHDTYKGVKNDIQTLLDADPPLVIAISHYVSKKEVLYSYDQTVHFRVSPAVAAAWAEVPPVDKAEQDRFLVRRGIKKAAAEGTEAEKIAKRKKPGQRKPRAGGLRGRAMTNSHLLGTSMDITRDFKGSGASGAFK